MTQARLTTKRSGSGGAHLRLAMFGVRGPLLSPEGEGGASGAGGTSGEGGAGQAPSNGDPGAKGSEAKFTQGQVDEIVKDRLAKAQRATQQQQPPRSTSDDDGDTKPLTLRELKAQLDESNARRDFDRKAMKLGLADEAVDDLFTLSRAQKPADLDAWLGQKSKLFGSGAMNGSAAAGANANASQAQQQQAPQQASQQKPAAAPAPPGSHDTFVDTGGMTDIYLMDKDKLKAMSPQQVRELHERNVQLTNQTSGAPPMPRIGMQQPKR